MAGGLASVLRIKPEMIAELAMGGHDPITIAEKYGYTHDDYIRFSTYAWFHRAVEAKRETLEAEGFTVQNKMAGLAEDLLMDAYEAAVKSDSVQNKLDVAKYLAKIGGLEPQPGAALVSGGGFQLTINIPPSNNSPTQHTIKLNAEEGEILPGEDFEFPSQLPPPPEHVDTSYTSVDLANAELAYED